MFGSQLPEHASLEYLKRLAKNRLRELRLENPEAKLATALLTVAREFGFSSWSALKSDIEDRQRKAVSIYFEACKEGDANLLRKLLTKDPALIRSTRMEGGYQGWTGLHEAAKHRQQEIVRLLLDHGADPNAREAGDNTYPLHWAAAAGDIEIVRMLLDAGGDVNGFGDVHELDAIGWATCFRNSDSSSDDGKTVSLLLERGARHHIFSAIAMGDPVLIQELVEENPALLDRRMSRFERGQSPLHFVISRKRYDLLDLLIELGADLEAEDNFAQTALAVAMLKGDREAAARLQAAGAQQPEAASPSTFQADMAELAAATKKGVPMISVPDIAETLGWYVSIGFKEVARYEADGIVNFGMLSFGKAELMLRPDSPNAPSSGKHRDVSLWFYTDEVDRLYRLLKDKRIEAAQGALAGQPEASQQIEFEEDIYDPFYGGRQFSIRDLNGYTLIFLREG